jgi:hypothetical protein
LNQHITLEDRQNAFQLFQNHYGTLLHEHTTLLLDNPQNDFNTAYPSWPFRVWIVDETQHLAYKGMANADSGFSINLEDVKNWLRIFVSRQLQIQLTPMSSTELSLIPLVVTTQTDIGDQPSTFPPPPPVDSRD